jgi:hypothetical protein
VHSRRSSIFVVGRRQRWRRRRRNLFRPRVASDLNHRPDTLAIRAAMIMLDISELRMKNGAASRA